MLNIINFMKQLWQLFITLIDKIGISVWILLIIIFTIMVQYTIGDSRPILNSALSALSAVTIWWICHHKYQSIQSPPKLKVSNVTADGFTFISFKSKGISKLSDFSEYLKPERESSGLMWEGFTTGISRENGKAGSIAVWLYGSNEGVGHYVYLDRTNMSRSGHGEGHFNLKPYAKNNVRWQRMALREACERVAEAVGPFYRHLSTSYDEKSGKISWYDDEAGREVYFREKRTSSLDDLFVFGPYPKKLKEFVGRVEAPGLIITPVERAEKQGPKRINISAKDIYGKSLQHVCVEVEDTESGYSFRQGLPSNGEYTTISVPQTLQKLMIKVWRGGYGNIVEKIELEMGDVRVEAILEPSREDG